MNSVRRQLREIKKINGLVNPDRSWVVAGRERLLQQIGNTVIPIEKPAVIDTAHAFLFHFRSSAMFRVMRPALTALTVAALATGGWIASVSASFNSLPGDRLWAVKRVAQNTEVAVRSFGASNDKKVQLQLNLAKNRVDDIKKAVNHRLINTSPNQLEKAVKDLNVATRDVQDAVKQVSENVADQAKIAITKDNQLQVVETVKDVAKDTTALTKELTSAIVSSTAAGVEVTKQVLETVRVLNQTSINAVEVVVQNQEGLNKNGGETGTAKTIVSEKILDLVQSTEALTKEVKNTFGMITTTSTKPVAVTEELKLTVTTPTGTAVVILPVQMPVKLIESPVSVKEATSSTESAVEIKKNIDSGNLQEAVKGLRELNESVVTAQQLLVETKTRVEKTETDKTENKRP